MDTMNQWFSSLPPERQKVLRDDKWMLASAAFEAGALQAKTKLSELQALCDSQQEQLTDLERFAPTADDVDKLRLALCNAGIAGPESHEELGNDFRSYCRALFRAVNKHWGA